ncbi:MAG: hypothetical protein ACRDU4_02205 [Mycobacterium sp.]
MTHIPTHLAEHQVELLPARTVLSTFAPRGNTSNNGDNPVAGLIKTTLGLSSGNAGTDGAAGSDGHNSSGTDN